MAELAHEDDAPAFETAEPGTIYWTLSLFIEPERVAAAAGQPGEAIRHDQFGALQAAHVPSGLLRDAIEPLFNDIADREVLGEVQEHLLAACDCPGGGHADDALRRPELLQFKAPPSVRWSTEGLTYVASPEGLGQPRTVKMRRFWLAHNNGALSYHMSFSHRYASEDAQGGLTGYDPSTYYFLSLLQKLAAPKEFALRNNRKASVFDEDLGISPLDDLTVSHGAERPRRFWPFVRDCLLDDAERLLNQLCRMTGKTRQSRADLSSTLIDLVPFIEVPGLQLPKSRFMFLLHDTRFFNRLLPVDTADGTGLSRKLMVQELCYAPYQRKLEQAISVARRERSPVELADEYWQWVTARGEYGEMIAGESPALGRPDGGCFASIPELAVAMKAGEVIARKDAQGSDLPQPVRLCVPAFEAGRSDCLDYLFLSGFNQNIIDFMNQDTSEILDSIDPIYPDSEVQADERFFVRYANHRAMITYVPKSRSLETGNDYIGTCPYAFLIHVLALHNEFLARSHEARSLARIARIARLVGHSQQGSSPTLIAIERELDALEPLDGKTDFDKAELAINQAKFAEYREYERFRYANPFRYDTEQVVYAKLEELRGTKRKKEALALAVATLEDHASDLQRRQQSLSENAAQNRDRTISTLLGATGVFGAGQMIYWIGEKAAGDKDTKPKPVDMAFVGMPRWEMKGEAIMDTTTHVMFYALIGFCIVLALLIGSQALNSLRSMLRRSR